MTTPTPRPAQPGDGQDYGGLTAELRGFECTSAALADPTWDWVYRACDKIRMAATAIEALQAERNAANAQADEWCAATQKQSQSREAAEAELAELRAVVTPARELLAAIEAGWVNAKLRENMHAALDRLGQGEGDGRDG